MSGRRANVDRELYVSALADAINYQRSILWTHDAPLNNNGLAAYGCCQPLARCEQYERETQKLVRYTRAQARLKRARRE